MKVCCVNLSVLIFAFTVFEAYIIFKTTAKTHNVSVERGPYDTHNKRSLVAEDNTLKQETQKPLLKSNDLLGYMLQKNNRMSESKYFKDELIYSVNYTIGDNGLRITPEPRSPENPDGCVLFFGGSFTFGSGLNDKETIPFQIGLKSKGKYRIYNFGVTGYGPHHMLSAIEHKFVENIVACNKNMIAIYLANADHVARSAGLKFWDKHGPRYILNKDGEVEFAGNFDDRGESTILKELKKSHIFNFALSQKQIYLLVSIVSASKTKLEKLYPGIKFSVLLWDKAWDKVINECDKKIYDGLRSKGINIYLLSKIVPDYKSDKDKYVISIHDGHPNALINENIAEYIVKEIIEK